MNPETIRTRGVVFAFWLGPPKSLERNEAAAVHGKVCDALRLDDITFKYTPWESSAKPTARSFSVQMERAEGRGGMKIALKGNGLQAPLTLVMDFTWPTSLKHVTDYADMIYGAVHDVLGPQVGRILAEVRIRAECNVPDGDALGFIRENMLRLNDSAAEVLGDRTTFASVEYSAMPVIPHEGDSLENPLREVRVEVLKEDRRNVYLELMSQWAPLPKLDHELNLSAMRLVDRNASEYINNASEFLVQWANAIARQGGGE